MKVILVVSNAEGHQLILHTRTILHECHRRGWTTHLVVPPSVVEHKTWAVLQTEFGDKLTHSLMPEPDRAGPSSGPLKEFRRILGPDFSHRRAYLAGLAEAQKSFRADAIYLVSMESADRSIGLLGFDTGSVPVSGMLMGRFFHYGPMGVPVPMGKFERLLTPIFFKNLLRRKDIRRIALIDPLLEEYIQRENLDAHNKVKFVPDIGKLMIVPADQSLRPDLGIGSEEFVLLSFGWLHPRKGIAELLGAMDHPSWPARARVLMVGSARPEAKVLLESELGQKHIASGRLIVKEGFADDLMEGRSFATADAIWLGYRGHFTMSGVLVQACLAGKPVVSMNQGLIGWYTRRYGIGVEVDIDSSENICQGILKFMSDPQLVATCQANCKSIAELHAPGSFERSICDTIEDSTK